MKEYERNEGNTHLGAEGSASDIFNANVMDSPDGDRNVVAIILLAIVAGACLLAGVDGYTTAFVIICLLVLPMVKITPLSYRPVIWPNGKKGPYMWQDPEE